MSSVVRKQNDIDQHHTFVSWIAEFLRNNLLPFRRPCVSLPGDDASAAAAAAVVVVVVVVVVPRRLTQWWSSIHPRPPFPSFVAD